MNNPNICFLFNAHSNRGKARKKEADLRKQISSKWPNAEFIKTEPDEEFWDDLPNRLKGTNQLIACGGDGTVHRTGNLAVKLNAELGVIPLGSGNDFAHMLKIPTNFGRAIEHLQSSGIRAIDLIKVDGDLGCYCLNTVGIGLDGLANHYTNIYKQKIGKAGYVAGALKAVLSRSDVEILLSVDNHERIEKFLMVTACNGRREGGSFTVAPDAEVADGLIDLLLVKPMILPVLLIAIPVFMTRFRPNLFRIERLKCKYIQLKCKTPVYIHVDGEHSKHMIRNLSLQMNAAKLRVIA